MEFGARPRWKKRDKAERLKQSLQAATIRRALSFSTTRCNSKTVWEIRESGLGATAFVPGEHDTWPGWEDAAVRTRSSRRISPRISLAVGKAWLQLRPLRPFRSRLRPYAHRLRAENAAGTRQVSPIRRRGRRPGGPLWRFAFRASTATASRERNCCRSCMVPSWSQAFREFKSIWDPEGKMNPGQDRRSASPGSKIWRWARTTIPPGLQTHFDFPKITGDFAHATLRCVGVGKCRRTEGGTMCPSYMVTREEKHTTRGRAHLLFEMLQGDVIDDGWQSEEVKEALDLCLACKGCKGECPVNVDMATYKAEFLSHYYERHPRPRSAYAMGWIYWWARLRRSAPGLVNWVSHAPGFAASSKRSGGIAHNATLPEFAAETFPPLVCRRAAESERGTQKSLLWPDTFNNYFHPQVGQGSRACFGACRFRGGRAGRASLCCGRPLYDYGMLETAKKLLRQILEPCVRRSAAASASSDWNRVVWRCFATNYGPLSARRRRPAALAADLPAQRVSRATE